MTTIGPCGKHCFTCHSGYPKPSDWIKGDKCPDCGHIRCSRAPVTTSQEQVEPPVGEHA